MLARDILTEPLGSCLRIVASGSMIIASGAGGVAMIDFSSGENFAMIAANDSEAVSTVAIRGAVSVEATGFRSGFRSSVPDFVISLCSGALGADELREPKIFLNGLNMQGVEFCSDRLAKAMPFMPNSKFFSSLIASRPSLVFKNPPLYHPTPLISMLVSDNFADPLPPWQPVKKF